MILGYIIRSVFDKGSNEYYNTKDSMICLVAKLFHSQQTNLAGPVVIQSGLCLEAGFC
jgi:hypothetical protein